MSELWYICGPPKRDVYWPTYIKLGEQGNVFSLYATGEIKAFFLILSYTGSIFVSAASKWCFCCAVSQRKVCLVIYSMVLDTTPYTLGYRRKQKGHTFLHSWSFLFIFVGLRKKSKQLTRWAVWTTLEITQETTRSELWKVVRKRSGLRPQGCSNSRVTGCLISPPNRGKLPRPHALTENLTK